jgi:hypothetical protein
VINKCFWTHAKGESFGWWAKATHPADTDANGDIIQNTAWSIDIHNAKTLQDAVDKLSIAIYEKEKESGRQS